METSIINDLKIEINCRKVVKKHLEIQTVVIDIIKEDLKDIKNALKQAGFGKNDELEVLNHHDNLIEIAIRDYFPEKSTTAEVIEGIESIKNDINLIKTFDVLLLADLIEADFTIDELVKTIVNEEPDDNEVLLEILGIDICYYCEFLEDYFIVDALDYLDNDALSKILYDCIYKQKIYFENIISVIGNYINCEDEMETLLHIASKYRSIKYLIEIYQKDNEGQAQS